MKIEFRVRLKHELPKELANLGSPTFLDLFLTDVPKNFVTRWMHAMTAASLLLPVAGLFVGGATYLVCLLTYAIAAIVFATYCRRSAKAFRRVMVAEMPYLDGRSAHVGM